MQPLYVQLATTLPSGKPESWDDKQQKAFEVLAEAARRGAQADAEDQRAVRAARSQRHQHHEQARAKRAHAAAAHDLPRRSPPSLLGLLDHDLGRDHAAPAAPPARGRAPDRRRRLREPRSPSAGPPEVADLAREFNSMGRAVEERERELVRVGAARRGRQDGRDDHARGAQSAVVDRPQHRAARGRARRGPQRRRGARTCAARSTARSIGSPRSPRSTSRSRGCRSRSSRAEPINAMVGALAAFVREDLAASRSRSTTELGADDPIGMIDAGADPAVPDQPRAQRGRGGRGQGRAAR